MKKRQVSYRWRLREVMAEHGMFATTEIYTSLFVGSVRCV